MDHVKISVIIPVYNAEKYLKECLDSIVNQTLKEIEIICVNDGSTDNSLDIINDFFKKDRRIKYYTMSNNSGAGPARNKGIEHATGDYISFIDSDDFITDNTAYEKLYQFADKNNANIVSANLNAFNSNGEIYKLHYTHEIKDDLPIVPQNYGIPWFFQKNLFKRQFLEENEIRFPDYKRGQDPVFLAKALANVDLIFGLPIDFYTYRTSTYKQITGKKEIDYIKHFRDVFEILNESKFDEMRLEYEKNMYNFFINQKFRFLSKSLEKNIKSIFGENSKVSMIYKLKCSLLEKENKIKNLQSSLLKKENIIQKIMSSNSWKLTKPLRNIGTRLKDPKEDID